MAGAGYRGGDWGFPRAHAYSDDWLIHMSLRADAGDAGSDADPPPHCEYNIRYTIHKSNLYTKRFRHLDLEN